MPTGQQYSSNAVQSALSGGITNSATSFTVTTTSGFPTITGGQAFTIALDVGLAAQELCDVTNVTGLTLTVTRGIDGSSAQAHANAATVTHVYIGRDVREARAHIDAIGGNDSTGKSVHGLTGNVVGTTDNQTLTNKILTSPSINNITTSGITLLLPNLAGTLVSDNFTQTLTNKTINSPVLNGTATGTYTLGGTPTITAPTVTGTMAAAAITASSLISANAGLTVANGQALTVAGNLGNPIQNAVGLTYTANQPFSGTGFSVGNGTTQAYYVQYGRWVFFFCEITRGSTTSFGTVGLSITLPKTTLSPGLSWVSMYQSAGSTNFLVQGYTVAASVTTATLACGVGNTPVKETGMPSTPGVGDILVVSGLYQATS